MSDIAAASKLHDKYTRFRILVIGRTNAGKTTLLKRVCNTTEEPCIYDDQGKNLFIFHDSPGFEAGDEAQLKTVQEFIRKCANATEVYDQLHAIWSPILTFISAHSY
ncbi:hypothetical protein DXG01_014777 [Tephrocybe rancida]|nr:hypothetical protein DXG01_014777 [Tephrocybe rancida]